MLIILSGPTGSGKSTTAALLKKNIQRPALVELDSLRDFIVDVPHDKALPVVLQMGIEVTRKLLAAKYNVIFVYPLYNSNYAQIKKALGKQSITSFILSPEKKKIQFGRGKRKLIPWEKNRINYQYTTGLHKASFGIKIDNSLLSPARVVREIIKHLPIKVMRKG